MKRKFGKLRVVGDFFYVTSKNGKYKYKFVKVRCSCDDKEKDINYRDLLDGSTTSCGCTRSENARKLCKKNTLVLSNELIEDFKNGLNCKQLSKKYKHNSAVIRLKLNELGYDTSRTGEKSSRYTGYKELSGRYWSSIKCGAKSRNLDFLISLEYAWSIIENQNFKCALSGLEIKFSTYANGHDGTASLDRIDSSKGYVEGNVQWIHKKFQNMKGASSDADFIQNCKEIYEYNCVV